MSYNIEFQVCSVIILVNFFILFASKNRKWTIESIVFFRLMIGTMVLAIDDIILCVALTDLYWPEWTRQVFGRGYLVIMHFCIATLLQYTVILPLNNNLQDSEKKVKRIFYSLMPVCTVLGIITAFIPVQYVSDGSRNVHIYGISQDIAYASAVISAIHIIVYTIAHRTKIDRKKIVPVYAYCTTALIASVLQFFFPYLLLSTLAVTLSIVSIYVGLENPDIKLVEALDEARKEADEANRAKSVFLARMSHEIRTPINVILGMDEVIMRETEEKETLEKAGNIKSAGEYLLGLINDILDFSKIESGKLRLVSAEYDITEVLNNVIMLGRSRAEGKDLAVNIHVDEDLPIHLCGDSVRLSQCISNLVSNAVKYTPSGRVDLTVGSRMVNDGNVELHISVKDTGIGIKEENLSKLSGAYERFDEKKNKNIEGTGLGLNITQSLLGMMGSKLKVSSRYGEGSEFCFNVVQQVTDNEKVGDYDARIAEKADRSRKSREIFTAPGKKLLIVDDLPMNLMVITQLLKESQIQVTTATSGTEALNRMKETRYDLIMLDQMMPDMDGAQTLEKSRTMEGNLNLDTPVVAFTADATVETKQLLDEKGFSDVILKPVVPVVLEEKLRSYLK